MLLPRRHLLLRCASACLCTLPVGGTHAGTVARKRRARAWPPGRGRPPGARLLRSARARPHSGVPSFPPYHAGVLLWEIVTGELPLRGRLAAPRVPQQCPQPVADLIVRCMQEDPNARPTAAQLVRGQQGAAGLACGSCRRGVSTHADWAG